MQPLLPFDAKRPEPGSPGLETGNSAPRTPNSERLVFVRHSRARRYVITIREDGRVRVTVPRWGSLREARNFAEREWRWIEKQRARVEPPPAEPDPVVLRVMRERAKRELPARLMDLARQHGLTVSRISIRNQRWRWGSCSRDGHICLNWRLVTMPDPVRDYVMIHELMHLRRLDHSPKFWKLVAAACPDYRSARMYLRALRN
jgi:predicted metal-dependent hydrolase